MKTMCPLGYHHNGFVATHDICVQVHELPQSHFRDNREGTLYGSHKLYKKPNDTLLYINKNPNLPPEIIKKLPKTINVRLCRNSSNAEIFHASKIEYETALRNSGYENVDFKYNLVHKNDNKRSRQRNIIWFNSPFSQAVSTNIAKLFLELLDKHFPQNNQLHKILNRNTVKVSYSCMPNVGSIINSQKKKLTNAENKQTKQECQLEGKCRSEDTIYKCVVTATGHPQKV